MSKQMIQHYRAEVERLIQYGGSRNESVLRKAFQELLDLYARSKNLMLIPEVEFITTKGHKVYPDGTLKDALRQDWGYWESKDEKDNLDEEIKAKLAKGYPTYNILFEDTHRAVLYQNNEVAMTASFDNDRELDELLSLFVGFEPKEVREFHKAIEMFTADVPNLAQTLREIIDEQVTQNPPFNVKLNAFLELCKKSINPNVEMADAREMIIQHILTEDIFMRVFDEADFHRENVIARNLQEVVNTFYTGSSKRNIHDRIAHYYETINAKASQISDHHEKQKFLKALYESFYRAYNPKAADRLGVIYTPDEIVRFMVEGTDYLLNKHFGKSLGEQYVEILDPATGTGTFITEIIEYLPSGQLEYKYENEIHCNEVAILPYYIANLNIEFTYKQKSGKFKEFENILFVDTLDNIGFSRSDTHQLDFFGIWNENAERIGRQNSKKISVIIGNPPYNANQLNENENNKNREYPVIDKRIKETYIANSTAQKTKMYDMYSRFYRWAGDRINEKGIVAFITNRSFLDSRTFDGFRKVVADEFSDIYIVDLGGDVRKNPKLSGPKNNVFAIQTGVAIAFMVKTPKKGKQKSKIYYARRPELEEAHEKLEFLNSNKLSNIEFKLLQPDNKNNWLNQPDNSWDELIPVAIKDKKNVKRGTISSSIFSDYFLGVSTNRDEWVYDIEKENLNNKVGFFIDKYNEQVDGLRSRNIDDISDNIDYSIKWSDALKRNLLQKKKISKNNDLSISCLYRPFTNREFYSEKIMSDRLTENHYKFFGEKLVNENTLIAFSSGSSSKSFCALASKLVVDLHLIGDSQCLSLYYFDNSGNRTENITDFALKRFRGNYNDKTITKLDIFHYTYAVLHNPQYKEEYRLNLKLESPRIPLYKDFWQWAGWGKQLMDLHLGFEQADKYPLVRDDKPQENKQKGITPKLKAVKDKGMIEVDSLTTLSGIPKEAWDYRLGTYSALEWILEGYKEKNPKDPTIREKFNTYRFADYKEQVIDLLMRVCTVSVETIKIINQMPKE